MPLFDKQLEFMHHALDKRYRFLLYGGGVGGGKTIVSLGFADEMCQRYPGIRVCIIRKTLRAIKRNTWPSFEKILKANGERNRAELHRGDATYAYKNGSEVIFMGCNTEDDPELNDLKGLEVTFIVLEEANELHEKVFDTSFERAGRWLNKEFDIPPLVICTTNPSNNWVKHRFYEPWSEGQLKAPFYFQQALPHHNPHLPKSYIENLEYLPEAEYERMVKGNWDYSDIPNLLTPYVHFKTCIAREDELLNRKPKYLGIDVAREGNDKTILCFGDELGILFFEEYRHDKCRKTAPIIKRHKSDFELEDSNIIFDANGNGAAMEEALNEQGIFATLFKSQEKAQSAPEMKNYIFRNKRAEAAWMFRRDVYREEILYPFHKEFQKQCLAIKYKMPDNYICIESKEKIKKELGYSPDYHEAGVMMNYVRHGFGWGSISFKDFFNSNQGSTMLVKQDIKREFDKKGRVSAESIVSTFGETMAPSYLKNVSSLAY